MSVSIDHDLPYHFSAMAENLIGSEIIRIAGEVNEKIKKGENIHNLTIGDFDPGIFPIPKLLLQEIIIAYQKGHTNYPAANGITELRNAIATFHSSRQGLAYSPDEILVAGGARPLIYATYLTLLDRGDSVIFPVPSWNNNHYCHLTGAHPVFLETGQGNNFMPMAHDFGTHLPEATLISLCSPLNPTGTVFTKDGLMEICDLILKENLRRKGNQKPLYLMYDQIYWTLTFGNSLHFDPVSLMPEMKPYTIYIDGISKAFAATGVRVGWALGPKPVLDKMKAILSHIGAWAPKAEQVATAALLKNDAEIDEYLQMFKQQIEQRLVAFFASFMKLKEEGFPVDVISPQAAIYLTVKIDLCGKTTGKGNLLATQKQVTDYVLNEAKMALVPFSAFGASDDSPWYRLSVGTCHFEEIPKAMSQLRVALSALS